MTPKNFAMPRGAAASLVVTLGCVALAMFGLFLDLFDPQQQWLELSRRLRPAFDLTTQQRYVKSYLGGLSPPIDKDGLPMFLRDTSAATKSMQTLYDWRERDLAFFWHIPRAGGSTMKVILQSCFDLRRAEKLNEPASMEFARDNVLNMDTSSPEGLADSYRQQIANSEKVDVIVSNYFLAGASLFTKEHRGRTFTILRHPIDVARSLFYFRRKQRADWLTLSFHDYVASDGYMDNWMTRQLTGTLPWEELDGSHLARAQLVLERKVFLGSIDHMEETIRQLRAHYGWEERAPGCVKRYLDAEPINKNEHAKLQGGRGGKTWNLLYEKDRWDLKLHQFGQELLAKQRERYPPEHWLRGNRDSMEF